MFMTDSSHSLFRFSEFTFDTLTGELKRKGISLSINKQTADILTILLRNAGQLVTREELRNTLWPDGEIVNYGPLINNGINRLRYLLRDTPKNAQYIECLPKRGYRMRVSVEFIPRETPPALAPRIQALPVESSLALALAQPVAETPAQFPSLPAERTALAETAQPSQRPIARFRHRTPAMAAAFALLFLAALGLAALWAYRHFSPAKKPQYAGIVLGIAPLDNNSPEAADLASSFRLELADSLSRIPQIHVRAIYSLEDLRRRGSDLSTEAAKLGLDDILLGSFTGSGNQYHLQLELVSARDATHMASFEYSGTPKELASIRENAQQEIFTQILLADNKNHRPSGSTDNPEAYKSYLRGRYNFFQGSSESLRLSLDDYQKAIALDPNFAQAYTGLSRTWIVMGARDAAQQQTFMRKASETVDKARSLDPASAEVHSALGMVDLYRNWDWSAAEREDRQAIQLDPNLAIYHQWYAVLLCDEGRYKEAFHELDIAHQNDPDWYPAYITDFFVSTNARDNTRMAATSKKLLEMRPATPKVLDNIANSLWYSQRYVEAIHEWRTMAEMEKDQERIALEDRGLDAYRHGGARAYAQVRLDAIRTGTGGVHIHPNDSALVEWYAVAGDKQAAIADLNRLIAIHDTNLLNILLSPVLVDNLRDTPEYRAALFKVGLGSAAPGHH